MVAFSLRLNKVLMVALKFRRKTSDFHPRASLHEGDWENLQYFPTCLEISIATGQILYCTFRSLKTEGKLLEYLTGVEI